MTIQVVPIHLHTDIDSNLHSPDSVVKIPELINKLKEMNIKACAITGHDSLSGHYRFWRECEKNNIKPLLGWEGYLDLEDESKYYHILLIAKNMNGLINLRELSSKAWLENYYYRPRIKLEWLEEFGEDIIITDACLGGFVKKYLLKIIAAENKGDKKLAFDYYKYLDSRIKQIMSYTNDFYIELQASLQEEQILVNQRLVGLAEHYGLKLVCSSDVHYLRPEDKKLHELFLKSREDNEREQGEFYDHTYLMSYDEMFEVFKTHLDENVIVEMINNTNKIADMVEKYELSHSPVLPVIKDVDVKHYGYFDFLLDDYEYISKYYNSEYLIDRYWLSLIEKGHLENIKYNKKYDSKKYIDRIEEELKVKWLVSEKIGERMSQYYVSDYVHIRLAREAGSLTGVARGSAGAMYTCYCAGTIQVDPVEYNLPVYRHIDYLRPELADKDNDHQPEKKDDIMAKVKEYHGEDRVISVCTFGTVSSKSALQAAGRGLGIDYKLVQKMCNLIPVDRGKNWTIKDCLYGNKEKGYEPVERLVEYSKKHPELFHYANQMTGLVDKRSQHASAVNVYDERYTKYNAAMKTPSGQVVTQFEMHDSESTGAVKYDFLYTEQQTKKALALESIDKTYEELLHPRVLDLDDKNVYENIFHKGKTKTVFQWETQIGINALKKLKPNNILELTAGNNLIRLIGDGIDRYIRYKNNPELFDEDYSFLTEEERDIIKDTLKHSHYVGITQEDIMQLSMRVGFSRLDANRLRKSIAKKVEELLEEEHKELISKGLANGFRKEFLNTLWDDFIKPLEGYAFSIIHGVAYSIEGYQSAWLLYYYPLHWYKACLTVASGALDIESEDNKSSNYGKLATVVADIQSEGFEIVNPDINQAKYGFEIIDDKLMFGLKGLSYVGDWVVEQITKNRPYVSFKDFVNKNVLKVSDGDKSFEKRIMLSLIGAGCFDNIEKRKSRQDLFIEYIKLTHKYVKQVDIRQYNEMCGYGIVPKGLKKQDATQYIKENRSRLVDEVNRYRMNETYKQMLKKELKGNERDWEFNAMNVYIKGHAMDSMKNTLDVFYDMEEETPYKMASFTDKKTGEKIRYRRYEISKIGGTVLDRDNNKKQIEILSPHGEVVVIKLYDNDWDEYNDILKRGNKLIIHGYRWNDNFRPKIYWVQSKGRLKSIMLLEDYSKAITNMGGSY